MNRTLRRTVAGVACAALLLPATGCGLFGDDKPKAPSYPKAWDSRVEPYVELAEELRDLEFKHPVHVEFQEPKEFAKALEADKAELDDEDLEELEQFTGMLRAMGLVHGDVDLFDETNKLTTGGTLAYYSFEDEKVRVRGTEITPAVKSTLVHELVHVLQDQRFDVGATSKKLHDAEDSSGLAFQALVEGDASRIETAYAEQLTPQERKALRRDEARQAKDAEASIKDVPEVLQTMMGAPYVLGEALLDVAMLEGEDEVDDLFADPPTTEEHLLDPFTLTEDGDEPRKVNAPTLVDGQKKFDSNTFESTGWLLTLAARIPLPQALRATDGWGGDQYVAYTEDKRSCVQIRYVGDTDRDAEELRSALGTWIERGPAGNASVVPEGDDGLLFTSCDPGTNAESFGEHSDEALTLALSRTYITHTLVDDDMDTDAARCFATALVENFSLEDIQRDEAPPEMVAEFRRLAEGCAN